MQQPKSVASAINIFTKLMTYLGSNELPDQQIAPFWAWQDHR